VSSEWSPFVLHEISVLIELTLGHLCYRLTAVVTMWRWSGYVIHRWREDCTAEDKQNMRIDNFRKLMNSEGCGVLINREREFPEASMGGLEHITVAIWR
jgi:hypothetical protein